MYGSRRLAHQFGISRDKARRLMQDLYLVATYPKRRTTIPNHEHKKFPYLLRDVVPLYPNHIWSTDITYIGLSLGFVYRKRRQTTADASEHRASAAVCRLLSHTGEPEFFNSDQGSQYTSPKFLSRFGGRQSMSVPIFAALKRCRNCRKAWSILWVGTMKSGSIHRWITMFRAIFIRVRLN